MEESEAFQRTVYREKGNYKTLLASHTQQRSEFIFKVLFNHFIHNNFYDNTKIGLEEAKTKKLVVFSRDQDSPQFGVGHRLGDILYQVDFTQVKVNLNYVDFKAEDFIWLDLLSVVNDSYVSRKTNNTEQPKQDRRERGLGALPIFSFQPKEVPISILGHCYRKFQPINSDCDKMVKF